MEQQRAVDGKKHCEKRLPLKWSSFEKEVIFKEFDFETSELDFEVPKSSMKAYNFV